MAALLILPLLLIGSRIASGEAGMTIAGTRARPLRADSIFFPVMALLMGIAALAGFGPGTILHAYFPASQPLSPVTPLLAVHGAVFGSWTVLLVVQTGLVAANRRDLHRTLGWAGLALAAAMVVLGLMAGTDALHRGFSPPGVPLTAAQFFTVPIGAIAAFVPLVILGIVNRRRPEYHKRYMLLSTLAILTAATARIPHLTAPPLFFGVTDLFIVAMAAYDAATRGRPHPATLWSGAILLASQVGRLAIAKTPLWLAFANAMTY
jgi:hypothetical protein